MSFISNSAEQRAFLRARDKHLENRRKCSRFFLCLLFIGASFSLRAQGPPFQTDDPVPVELHHYEFYIFGSMDGTPAEIDSTGPAFEFNWGAIPRVQLHVIAPWGTINPSNNPIYAPGGTGPSAFGFIDTELGAKIAFIKESKYIPQIGTFTMFEMPTGNCSAAQGLETEKSNSCQSRLHKGRSCAACRLL